MGLSMEDVLSSHVGPETRQESVRYGDLLVGNFTDHYYNNTLKFIHSIGLAKNFCGNSASGEGDGATTVPYVFLVDDDYLVSIRNLVLEAKR